MQQLPRGNYALYAFAGGKWGAACRSSLLDRRSTFVTVVTTWQALIQGRAGFVNNRGRGMSSRQTNSSKGSEDLAGALGQQRAWDIAWAEAELAATGI